MQPWRLCLGAHNKRAGNSTTRWFSVGKPTSPLMGGWGDAAPNPFREAAVFLYDGNPKLNRARSGRRIASLPLHFEWRVDAPVSVPPLGLVWAGLRFGVAPGASCPLLAAPEKPAPIERFREAKPRFRHRCPFLGLSAGLVVGLFCRFFCSSKHSGTVQKAVSPKKRSEKPTEGTDVRHVSGSGCTKLKVYSKVGERSLARTCSDERGCEDVDTHPRKV